MKIKTFINTLSFMVILLGSSAIAYSQTPDEASLGAVTNDITENPCPNPRQALENTPNNLQIIQEDITRFNLCLQRAQLLSRLNTLAEENADSINSSLDKKLQTIAGDFQPVPMKMPEVQMPKMPDIEIDVSNNNQDIAPPLMQIEPAIIEPPKEFDNWFINGIEGKNGVLIATLIDKDGNVAHVRSGQQIADTEIKVTNVSQTGVKVLEDKTSAKLKWKQ